MLGTIVNALLIIIGSIIGLLLKGGMKPRYREIVSNGMGLSVLFIGISMALGGMLQDEASPILYVISIVIGSIIGEKLGIEEKLEGFGDIIQNKLSTKESNISQGFVTTSLTFCVGTMSVLGSIESGTQGVHTILFTKAVLDGIGSIVFASTMGIGVVFSAISVFLYQGSLTILASYAQEYMTVSVLREISIVGGIMIFAIGCNLLEIKKFKVGNMLPAIFIPIIYFLEPVQAIFAKIVSFF